jgi:16S rRNA (cytidine1402-2'-O)-methyltransferase
MASASDSALLAAGLYLVATPIGNLEDITLRALRVLKQADLIACEDTRQTQKLLHHFGIATRMTSYHQHNERERAEELVREIEQGKRIAVVTDAGMPTISDPGFGLVRLAIQHGLPVIPVPGASAFLAALVASGFPTDSFAFHGFLPAKAGQRRQVLEGLRDAAETQVFYEAPHRIVGALQDIVEVIDPQRPVVVAREVTKFFEEFLRGPARAVLESLSARAEVRGEITLLIAKAEAAEAQRASAGLSLRQRVQHTMTEEKLDEKAALKRVARELGISKSAAYREWQRCRE